MSETPQFGKFVCAQKLGEGGMGQVWKAWDEPLKRWVALKFLKGGDAEEIARFEREAQVAAGLTHPNIAAVCEVGSHEGRHYIAMQYIEGRTLRSVRRNDRRALVRMVRDAARAVGYAHERGVVHRDLKPDNVMVEGVSRPDGGPETGDGGRVYVLDFGLARQIRGASNLSVSGLLIGTPAYMPPEQARGERADARSDVYALGATLYELLTDRTPFRSDDMIDLLVQVVNEEPKSPRRMDRTIDADLETIVLKCLEKERERRYATAGALADDLERWLSGEPISARPASVVYRLRKRLAKRKAVVVAAAAIAVAAALVPALWRAMAARTEAERALALWGRVSYVLAEAEVAQRQGDLDEARRRLAVGIDQCRKHLEGAELAQAHYFLGRMLRASGERDAARRELDRAIALEPRLAEAHLERGLLLAELADVQVQCSGRAPALAFAHGRAVASPTPAGFRLDQGAEVLARKAVEDLSWPLGDSPYVRRADGLYGAAELAYLRRQFDESERLYRRTIDEDRLYTQAELGLARVLWQRGRIEEAIAQLDSVLGKHRGLAVAFALRAYMQMAWANAQPESPARSRRLEQALLDCDACLRLRGMPSIPWIKAMIYEQLERLDEAIAEMTAYLPSDASSASAHQTLGVMRAKSREWAAAAASLDEALRLDPKHVDALTARAYVRTMTDDPAGAIDDLTLALAIAPDPISFLNRGVLREYAGGDREGALADYGEAIKLDDRSVGAYVNRAGRASRSGTSTARWRTASARSSSTRRAPRRTCGGARSTGNAATARGRGRTSTGLCRSSRAAASCAPSAGCCGWTRAIRRARSRSSKRLWPRIRTSPAICTTAGSRKCAWAAGRTRSRTWTARSRARRTIRGRTCSARWRWSRSGGSTRRWRRTTRRSSAGRRSTPASCAGT